jgi:hypothetical protein
LCNLSPVLFSPIIITTLSCWLLETKTNQKKKNMNRFSLFCVFMLCCITIGSGCVAQSFTSFDQVLENVNIAFEFERSGIPSHLQNHPMLTRVLNAGHSIHAGVDENDAIATLTSREAGLEVIDFVNQLEATPVAPNSDSSSSSSPPPSSSSGGSSVDTGAVFRACAVQGVAYIQVSGGQRNCPAVINIPSLSNRTTAGSLTRQYLDTLCADPCFRQALRSLQLYKKCLGDALGDDNFLVRIFDIVLTQWDVLCLKNGAGQYCTLAWRQFRFSRMNPTNLTACGILARLGCCAPAIMDWKIRQLRWISTLFQRNIRFSQNSDGYFFNRSLHFCNATRAPPCPILGQVRKAVKVVIRIRNFNFTVYESASQEVKDEFMRRFREVLAKGFNIDKAYISFKAFKAGSIIATFEVRGEDDAATTNLQSRVSDPNAASFALADSLPPQLSTAAIGTLSLDTSATVVQSETVGQTLSAAGRSSQISVVLMTLLSIICVVLSKHL